MPAGDDSHSLHLEDAVSDEERRDHTLPREGDNDVLFVSPPPPSS